MGDNRKFGKGNPRLPEFQKKFGMLVEEYGGVSAMAQLTGISRPTINFWYNGDRAPDAQNLKVLSEKLGKSADWFLGLADENNYTVDETIRLISDYTGLDNKAIEVLHSHADDRKQATKRKRSESVGEMHLKAINAIIETGRPLLLFLYEPLTTTILNGGKSNDD